MDTWIYDFLQSFLLGALVFVFTAVHFWRVGCNSADRKHTKNMADSFRSHPYINMCPKCSCSMHVNKVSDDVWVAFHLFKSQTDSCDFKVVASTEGELISNVEFIRYEMIETAKKSLGKERDDVQD